MNKAESIMSNHEEATSSTSLDERGRIGKFFRGFAIFMANGMESLHSWMRLFLVAKKWLRLLQNAKKSGLASGSVRFTDDA